VSIRTTPSTPRVDRPVELTASSAGRRFTYDWDLDGDGTFGDGSGATVSRVFPAGPRTVSVRATDQFGRTSTETRSVSVGALNVAPTLSLHASHVIPVGQPFDAAVIADDADGRVAKIELDVDGSYEVAGAGQEFYKTSVFFAGRATFTTGGDRVIRARVTDDAGATAVATSTLRVLASVPAASVSVFGDEFGHAPVAGGPATVTAGSTRAVVKYEFDLDGDGTYELDNGTTAALQTSFTAGTYVVGTRVTDDHGALLTARRSVFVFDPAESCGDKLGAARRWSWPPTRRPRSA
jgi:hypothetical protein